MERNHPLVAVVVAAVALAAVGAVTIWSGDRDRSTATAIQNPAGTEATGDDSTTTEPPSIVGSEESSDSSETEGEAIDDPGNVDGDRASPVFDLADAIGGTRKPGSTDTAVGPGGGGDSDADGNDDTGAGRPDDSGGGVDPVLAANRRHCWAGPADGYELLVAADGSVRLRAFVNDDAVEPVATTLESGRGRFISDTEIELDIESWTTDGFDSHDAVYTIAGDRLELSTFPGLRVSPDAGCDRFDRSKLATRDRNVYSSERIEFARGTSGTTIEGAVLRGEYAVYLLEMSKGQTLTVDIASLEDNAAVSVYTPDGHHISDNEDGVGSRSMVLPASGVYEVSVSSIRGNASFTLDVSVV